MPEMNRDMHAKNPKCNELVHPNLGFTFSVEFLVFRTETKKSFTNIPKET